MPLTFEFVETPLEATIELAIKNGAAPIYAVHFAQDDALGKPNSLVARFELLPETVAAALSGRQIQPLLR